MEGGLNSAIDKVYLSTHLLASINPPICYCLSILQRLRMYPTYPILKSLPPPTS